MKRRNGLKASLLARLGGILLVLVFVLSIAFLPSLKTTQAASGRIFYVDDVIGNDGNNGLTEGSAWKTIAKVNAISFVPGDQILFKRGGTWKETLAPLTSGIAGAPIIFGSFGTGALPILDSESIRSTSVNGSTRSYLTFQELDCRNGTSYGLLFDTADHIIVQNCVVSGAEWFGITFYTGRYILVEGCTVFDCNRGVSFTNNTLYSRAHNNVVHNCSGTGIGVGDVDDDIGVRTEYNEIDGNNCYANGYGGIYLERADHNLIHDNHSYNNGPAGGEPYGIGVRSSANNEIYDNEINDNAVHGIEVWSAIPPTYPNDYSSIGNKIYRNEIYNNAWNGIQITSPTTDGAQPVDNEVYYNLIYDNGRAGFNVSTGGTGSGNKLYNNTIVGNLGSSSYGIDFGAVGGWDVKNNNVANNASGELACFADTITHDHNLYHRTSGNVVYYNGVNYDSAHVTNFEVTALAFDSVFVNETQHDFRLQSTSTAINAGIDVGKTADFDGNPISGQPDIGCFESYQAPTPPTSFTLAGQVTQADNSGLNGITLSRSDGGGSVVTANGGSYSLTVPSGWSGQIIPSYSSGSFDPAPRSYSNVSANQSGQDFRWTAPATPAPAPTSFTLAGQVTQADNSGLNGITLSRSDGGGSVVTANGGSYSLTVPSGWSGQIIPSYSSGSFDPAPRSYSNVSANQSGQDFRWSQVPLILPYPPQIVSNPTIRVLTPNGGESWQIGSEQQITWTSTDLTGDISIQLSADGNQTWTTLFASTPNDGQKQWTVTGVVGNQNQVRITSTVTPSISDRSDSNFAIVKSKKKIHIAVNQGWNLIATPVQPDSNTEQVFANLPSGSRFYTWDSASLRYLTGTEVVSNIGNGYWLYSPITTNLDIEGNSYAGDLFKKTLPIGWNLIGSPSVDSYPLRDLRIELNANTYTYQEAVDLRLIAPGLFTYKSSQYEDAQTTGFLEPGSGYWIKTLVVDCTLVF